MTRATGAYASGNVVQNDGRAGRGGPEQMRRKEGPGYYTFRKED